MVSAYLSLYQGKIALSQLNDWDYIGAALEFFCAEARPIFSSNFYFLASARFRLLLPDRHALGKFYGQAERAISTGKLNASLRLHLQPINQLVLLGPS
jgi:hypothetical protein